MNNRLTLQLNQRTAAYFRKQSMEENILQNHKLNVVQSGMKYSCGSEIKLPEPKLIKFVQRKGGDAKQFVL